MFGPAAWNTILVVFIILIAGVLGGTINSFLFRETERASAENEHDADSHYMGRCLFYGLGASFVAPLFLRTIDSALLAHVCDLKTSQQKLADTLVFFGFCVLAAVCSRIFIRTIADRILREAREARINAQQARKDVERFQSWVNPIVAKETEPETESESAGQTEAEVPLPPNGTVDENEIKTLVALANPKYTLRARTGISTETGLDNTRINLALADLIESQLAGATCIGQSKLRYFITDKGRRAIAKLCVPTRRLDIRA